MHPTDPLRYLPAATVRELLPDVHGQIALVDAAYRSLRDGTAHTPATPEIEPRPGAWAHAMPAYVAEGDITSVKWISGNPANRDRGLPNISGLIVVNDSDSVMPIAVMDASAITAARTAAVSARCIEAFAHPEWSTVCIIGFGVQARAHIDLLLELQPAVTFRVYTRNPPREPWSRVEFFPDSRSAVDTSDVVITGVPLEVALEPPVESSWLSPNALVLPLDDDSSLHANVVNAAPAFYVDELDDFHMRQEMGRFIAWREPDDTVAKAIGGAGRMDGVTVCANQGMGVLDAVFADNVLKVAVRQNAGSLLDR